MTEELLALLEEGPQATAALAQWLQRPRLEVAHALRRMAGDGYVKQVGTAKQWALASFHPVSGRKPTLDREAIRRPDRPSTVKGPTDQELSFWVGCDRAELNRRIVQRQEAMRNSKAARFIDGAVRNF
jgi:hypothetical protein